MKLFTEPQVVPIPKSAVDKARDFAEKVVHTTNYADSNQDNMKKIIEDHFVGKIGEEAVTIVFRHLAKKVMGPDYEIYPAQQKTWDEDLKIDGVSIAVKTQKKSAALRYGLSWTFQSSGYRNDPIINIPDAWVCFVECDDNNDYKCLVYPPFQIKELTFKDPKLTHLKGKKKVIYASDLPQCINSLNKRKELWSRHP